MFTVFSYEMQDWTEQNVQVVVRMATLMQETVVITLQFSMWKGELDSFYIIIIIIIIIIEYLTFTWSLLCLSYCLSCKLVGREYSLRLWHPCFKFMKVSSVLMKRFSMNIHMSKSF